MSAPADHLLLAHAGVTCFLAGLIWTIQVVHYPLFARVGAGAFAGYERAHTSRITWVVAPVMFAELGLAIALLALVGGALAWAGAGLLAVIWVSTFAVQVPAHARLAGGFDARAHARLVSSNWVRTIAWSARSVISLVMISAQRFAAA